MYMYMLVYYMYFHYTYIKTCTLHNLIIHMTAYIDYRLNERSATLQTHITLVIVQWSLSRHVYRWHIKVAFI